MEKCKDIDLQINFYQWAKQDAVRELESGFPFLKAIKDPIPLRALTHIKSFRKEDRLKLVKSLVKGPFSTEILKLAGDDLNDEDIILRRNYDHHTTVNPIITLRDEERILRKLIADGSYHSKSARKQLKKLLKNDIKSLFKEADCDKGDIWSYKIDFGQWMIETEFDIGGYSQLRYYHNIYSPVQNCIFYPQTINFIKWLGMGGDTEWEYLHEEDLELASQTTVKLCSHFLDAAPSFLL